MLVAEVRDNSKVAGFDRGCDLERKARGQVRFGDRPSGGFAVIPRAGPVAAVEPA
jgi:hypothetical protein